MKKILFSFIIPFAIQAQVEFTITNGDFESSTAGTPNNWTSGLGTLTNGDAYQGTNGALLTSSAGSPNSNILNDDDYTLTGGLPTYLTAWVKPTINGDRSALRLVETDGSTNLAGGQAVVWNKAEFLNSWHKIMMSQYTPTLDTDAKIRIDNPIANDIINYDNIELIQNPLTVNGDMEVEFLANSATSPQTQIYQKNQINPFTRDSSISRSGNFSVKCVTKGINATLNQSPNYQHINESANFEYQGEIWVVLDAISPAADFTAELWMNGSKVGTGTTISINPTDDWTKIETPKVTSSTSGGKVYLKLICTNNGADRAIFFADDYTLTKTTQPTLSVSENLKNLDESITITKTGISYNGDSNATVNITDISGKTLKNKSIAPTEKLEFFFTESQLYLIQIISDNNKVVKKVIF